VAIELDGNIEVWRALGRYSIRKRWARPGERARARAAMLARRVRVAREIGEAAAMAFLMHETYRYARALYGRFNDPDSRVNSVLGYALPSDLRAALAGLQKTPLAKHEPQGDDTQPPRPKKRRALKTPARRQAATKAPTAPAAPPTDNQPSTDAPPSGGVSDDHKPRARGYSPRTAREKNGIGSR
jgi:hypothetical protein